MRFAWRSARNCLTKGAGSRARYFHGLIIIESLIFSSAPQVSFLRSFFRQPCNVSFPCVRLALCSQLFDKGGIERTNFMAWLLLNHWLPRLLCSFIHFYVIRFCVTSDCLFHRWGALQKQQNNFRISGPIRQQTNMYYYVAGQQQLALLFANSSPSTLTHILSQKPVFLRHDMCYFIKA